MIMVDNSSSNKNQNQDNITIRNNSSVRQNKKKYCVWQYLSLIKNVIHMMF